MTSLETTRLGHAGPTVSRLGMGCWAIGEHGWGVVNEEDSLLAVKYALENGVTFFDTADAYGLGKSETVLASALGPYRSKVVIASKGGVRWDNRGRIWSDISPAHLRRAVEDSLRRLKLDCIPLYYIHKPDNVTPIQESVAAMTRLREEGKIGSIGVANFSTEQLLLALQTAPVAAAQIRLNVFDRKGSDAFLQVCRSHDTTAVAWGVLADGLLTGKFSSDAKFAANDHRSRMAEFSGSAFPEYLKCVEALGELAASMGRSVSQLSLRWVLDSTNSSCALFGAKTDAQARQNLGADGWRMTGEQLASIDSLVAGLLTRINSYNPPSR